MIMRPLYTYSAPSRGNSVLSTLTQKFFDLHEWRGSAKNCVLLYVDNKCEYSVCTYGRAQSINIQYYAVFSISSPFLEVEEFLGEG